MILAAQAAARSLDLVATAAVDRPSLSREGCPVSPTIQLIDDLLEARRRGDDALIDEYFQAAVRDALESPEIARSATERSDLLRLADSRRDRVILLARGHKAALDRALDDLRRLRGQLTWYLVLSVAGVAVAVQTVLVLIALTVKRPLLGTGAAVVVVLVTSAAVQFRADIRERVQRARRGLGVPGWRELRADAGSAETLVGQQHEELRDALFHGLMPHLRERVADVDPDAWFERAAGRAPGLQQPFDVAFHVTTPTGERLVRLLRDLDGGSVALAGARGTGKTGLIEAIVKGHYAAEGVDPCLTVVMPAPVQYEPRDFVLQLFAAACERTKELAGSPGRSAEALRKIGKDAEQHLKDIRYQLTLNVESTQPLPVIPLRVGWGRTRREQTYPEIVERFHKFLQSVASVLVDHRGRQLAVPVLIAIDELDRMGSAENARTFLNEVKGAFSIRGCHFIVSVADETMQTYELAGTPLDVVVDRAFDEVVHMGHLDFDTVRRLLIRRVAPPFRPSHVALCYCLSGGIARDVVRTARSVAGVGRDRPSPDRSPDSLGRIAAEVVYEEIQNAVRWGRSALLRTGIEPLATNTIRWMDPWWRVREPDAAALRVELLRTVDHRLSADAAGEIRTVWERVVTLAYFLLTVMDVFHDDIGPITEDDVDCLEILARSRRALRANDFLARVLLAHFRTEWERRPLQHAGPTGFRASGPALPEDPPGRADDQVPASGR